MREIQSQADQYPQRVTSNLRDHADRLSDTIAWEIDPNNPPADLEDHVSSRIGELAFGGEPHAQAMREHYDRSSRPMNITRMVQKKVQQRQRDLQNQAFMEKFLKKLGGSHEGA